MIYTQRKPFSLSTRLFYEEENQTNWVLFSSSLLSEEDYLQLIFYSSPFYSSKGNKKQF